jgi:hypothetical protein
MNAPISVPNPFTKRSAKFNLLKRRTLEVFEERGWMNPVLWAVLVGFYPARASYSYLLRLHRFGLLLRRKDASGLVLYALSKRGCERLAWLRSVARADSSTKKTKGGTTG